MIRRLFDPWIKMSPRGTNCPLRIKLSFRDILIRCGLFDLFFLGDILIRLSKNVNYERIKMSPPDQIVLRGHFDLVGICWSVFSLETFWSAYHTIFFCIFNPEICFYIISKVWNQILKFRVRFKTNFEFGVLWCGHSRMNMV